MVDGVGPMRVETPLSATDPSKSLQNAAQEFESLFLDMMMKAMRQSVPQNELFGDGNEIRMYEEMRDQELSKVMARNSGLGLARMIVRQFEGREDEGLEELGHIGRDLRASERAARAYEDAASVGSSVITRPPSGHEEER